MLCAKCEKCEADMGNVFCSLCEIWIRFEFGTGINLLRNYLQAWAEFEPTRGDTK